MSFADRAEAGRGLAAALRDHPALGADDADAAGVLVLGLPRGGVPVAAEVATELGAPLDVLVVRKLGAPGQPELGLGAIGEGGIRVLDEARVRQLDVDERHLDAVAAEEEAELQRRVERYRRDIAMRPVEGRTVVLVDDGIATGGSARAAIAVVRSMGAGRVVLAVPVAAPATVEALRTEVDEVVVLDAPEQLLAIGQHYRDFAPTTDDEVIELLAHARATPSHDEVPPTDADTP